MLKQKSLLFELIAMNIYWKQSLTGAPWNQLKSENTESERNALKEPVQID